MSRLLAILFILIISVQTIHQGLIYAYYIMNKDYIIKKLCINKATPKMKCDGKCHLRDVLSIRQKEAPSNKLPIPNLEEIKVPVLYFQSLEQQWKVLPCIELLPVLTIPNFRYLFAYAYEPITAIFQPPRG